MKTVTEKNYRDVVELYDLRVSTDMKPRVKSTLISIKLDELRKDLQDYFGKHIVLGGIEGFFIVKVSQNMKIKKLDVFDFKL